ncbi:response regulator transcription factor [Baekduia soli]|uniref:Response regulator transcription factor n=1 Tax=Baekduia soli TaxID=496014 RepID=A0A5B8U782_9ACTN|nr:response regulator transcription factor [Baekduia soli]QEC48785.1 response regulator transcription factor [Baekduia soli]
MATRILIVEDDPDLRDAMSAALTADGHVVDACGSGSSALEALAEGAHRLVLLDVGLGAGLDGIEVCRRLRRADDDAYIMMITARGGEPDIVLALEAGADDYVTKPVGVTELRSRVRAALRRLGPSPAVAGSPSRTTGRPETLEHAGLSLDPTRRTAEVDGIVLELTRSEFAVLEELLRAGGAVRSRMELTRAIYGDDAYRDPRNVDVHLHHLRQKLDEAGGDPAWLVTVRGAGYRLGR